MVKGYACLQEKGRRSVFMKGGAFRSSTCTCTPASSLSDVVVDEGNAVA